MENNTRLSTDRSLDAAVKCAQIVLAASWDSTNQGQRVAGILERFAAFARTGFGVDSMDLVTDEIAAAFVRSGLPDGSGPSVPLLHLRRSALRLLFRSFRESGVAVGDPTLDLVLPPRSPLATRPLADDEVVLCRGHALWSLTDLRRAAAWALAEATCRSVEIAQVRVSDLDLNARRVWIHGGRTTRPRWGSLTEWGAIQLRRRVEAMSEDPAARVVYGGTGDADTGQVSASAAIGDVLTRAGLATEPDVRPASIAAWAGRRILGESGRIDQVARRLGMSSLDRTARFIAFDWQVDDR